MKICVVRVYLAPLDCTIFISILFESISLCVRLEIFSSMDLTSLFERTSGSLCSLLFLWEESYQIPCFLSASHKAAQPSEPFWQYWKKMLQAHLIEICQQIFLGRVKTFNSYILIKSGNIIRNGRFAISSYSEDFTKQINFLIFPFFIILFLHAIPNLFIFFVKKIVYCV